MCLVQHIKNKCRFFIDIDDIGTNNIENIKQQVCSLISKYFTIENPRIIITKNMAFTKFHLHIPDITIEKRVLLALLVELNENIGSTIADVKVLQGEH